MTTNIPRIVKNQQNTEIGRQVESLNWTVGMKKEQERRSTSLFATH